MDACADVGAADPDPRDDLPMMRVLPALYVWSIGRRLVYWHRELNASENNLDSGGGDLRTGAAQAEIDSIVAAVRRIRLPRHFSD